MARLILVSNRVAVPGSGAGAGGLVVAVNAAQRLRETVWLGWSGTVSETEAPVPPRRLRRGSREYVLVDLPSNDYQEYYNGFANRVLWPIFHYRLDLAEFNAVDLGGYLRVNRRFAEALAAIVADDDLIWVHDYHLLTLAREMRERGYGQTIGFMLHIPCPPPDIMLALPQHAETLGALAHYDLVGVQTERDAENLGAYFVAAQGATKRSAGVYEIGGRRVQVRAFPVAIGSRPYARAAKHAMRAPQNLELRESLGGRALILGVDRLDYTKGIPLRIQAFGQFLAANPGWLGRVTFLQVTPKSRSDVPEYAELGREVSTLVGEINGRHGEPAWTPIRYVNRSFGRGVLAGMYRMARIGLVTPLRDGMNLVAKEYVSAQAAEDPGVLVLSQFAGAAERLDGALLVNPHEPDAMAAAIREGLEMPLAERQGRWRRMAEEVFANDIDRWAEEYLTALAGARQGPTGLLRRLLSGMGGG